jgi:hypothetical protein
MIKIGQKTGLHVHKKNSKIQSVKIYVPVISMRLGLVPTNREIADETL